MKASEMLELAKAGYKPNEIAEMHKLMKEADPEVEPEVKQEENLQEHEENLQEREEKSHELEEIEKLKAQLAAAQKKNREADLSDQDKRSQGEKMADIVKGFF